uniref:NADH dehydrogenase subunit 4 n=1 Tax=Austromenopon paululum TaxID=2965261 RepID=UPI0026E1A962|nr:NADH dehydrogenase subunit 4 [Austromenopon paululum]WJJ69872.1 NADH dehydrogenase subunit 4 [Austromenopon paululum]
MPCFFMCEMWLAEILFIGSVACIPCVFLSWEMYAPSSLTLMTDKISGNLCMLSLWISALMLCTNSQFSKELKKKILSSLLILILLLSLVFLFSTSSPLFFFIAFEFSLLPTMGLISGWGKQPERVSAFMSFFFFTSVPSMALLTVMVSMSIMPSDIFMNTPPLWGKGGWMFLLLFAAFIAKLPLTYAHFWLPKAHVEAPLAGSMILAGVLLKMGGYGVIRFQSLISPSFWEHMIESVALVGMVWVSLMCLAHPDMKTVVAYSSVSHMSFLALGLFIWNLTSDGGGLALMISHGLVSSCLFFLVDCLYLRSSSRSLVMNKGAISTLPLFSAFLAIMCMLNMSFPPSLGCMSEMSISLSVIKKGGLSFLFLFFYFFLSALYSLYLYITLNHGLSLSQPLPPKLKVKEIILFTSHAYPLLGGILVSKIFFF